MYVCVACLALKHRVSLIEWYNIMYAGITISHGVIDDIHTVITNYDIIGGEFWNKIYLSTYRIDSETHF